MNGHDEVLTLKLTPAGISAAGEIDVSTVVALSDALNSIISNGSVDDVVLEMSAVDFIDSSGLRVLIDAHSNSSGHGRLLVISEPSSVVRRLLEVSGLHTHLHVVP
jgi:anti-sigma B factor antagonist